MIKINELEEMRRKEARKRTASKWNEPKRKKENENERKEERGEKSNSTRGVLILVVFAVRFFEITSLFYSCFKRFFSYFLVLLSWQWLLIFATFSFGFFFLIFMLLRWRYSLMRFVVVVDFSSHFC